MVYTWSTVGTPFGCLSEECRFKWCHEVRLWFTGVMSGSTRDQKKEGSNQVLNIPLFIGTG